MQSQRSRKCANALRILRVMQRTVECVSLAVKRKVTRARAVRCMCVAPLRFAHSTANPFGWAPLAHSQSATEVSSACCQSLRRTGRRRCSVHVSRPQEKHFEFLELSRGAIASLQPRTSAKTKLRCGHPTRQKMFVVRKRARAVANSWQRKTRKIFVVKERAPTHPLLAIEQN